MRVSQTQQAKQNAGNKYSLLRTTYSFIEFETAMSQQLDKTDRNTELNSE